MFDLTAAAEILRSGAAPPLTDDLEAAVAELADRLGAQGDALPPPDLAFVRHLARHLPAGAPLAESIRRVHAEDLCLAFFASRGNAQGIAMFEAQCFTDIPIARARIRSSVALDELKQQLREKLFVPTNDAPGRAALYGGVGPLRAWFRVLVVRHLLNLATRQREETTFDEAALAASSNADPELIQFRKRYSGEIEDAFRRGAAKLDRDDRRALRYFVCDHVSIDALAQLLGIHRATAARRVARARERLACSVREVLETEMRVDLADMGSIFRLVESHLDVSIAAALQSTAVRAPS